jgi:translation elongation factor EF-G
LLAAAEMNDGLADQVLAEYPDDCALDRWLGYITALRGMTHGRGQFTMTFDRFDVA